MFWKLLALIYCPQKSLLWLSGYMLVAQVFIQVISELFLERRNGKMSSIFMFQLKMMYTSQTEDILFKNYASLSYRWLIFHLFLRS